MIKKSIAILLTAYLLACPLLCKGGVACCDNDRSHSTHACCDSCHESETADSTKHDSLPRDNKSPAPVECGSCICGGAVVEDSAFQHLVLDGYNWIALPALDQVLAVFADLHRNTFSKTPLPDDGINPGRAMRCLMMSYLC